MYIKNDRIIINEDKLITDIEELEKYLAEFFKTDARFSMYDIEVSVNVEDRDNEYHCWYDLEIEIRNHNMQIELGGIYAGRKMESFVNITYSTENMTPQFVLNNNVPEFYYVFDFASSTLTNPKNWQNNDNDTTIEDIISNECLSRYHI